MWVQSLDLKDSLEKEMATLPVFLPGESHGQKSLAGCSPWGHKELDRTEATQHACMDTVLYPDFFFKRVYNIHLHNKKQAEKLFLELGSFYILYF